MTYNETTNTISFHCPACRVKNNLQFKQTFRPENYQEFPICCLACSTRLIVTSWRPLYVIRDLLIEKSLEKSPTS